MIDDSTFQKNASQKREARSDEVYAKRKSNVQGGNAQKKPKIHAKNAISLDE